MEMFLNCGDCGKPVESQGRIIDGKAYHIACGGGLNEVEEFEESDEDILEAMVRQYLPKLDEDVQEYLIDDEVAHATLKSEVVVIFITYDDEVRAAGFSTKLDARENIHAVLKDADSGEKVHAVYYNRGRVPVNIQVTFDE